MSANALSLSLSRLRRLLESRTLSFWVLGAWVALMLVWLIPFQLSGQSPATIKAIAEDWLAFRVVYALVGLTTLVCSVTRISRDLKRLRKTSAPPTPSADAQPIAPMGLGDVARELESDAYRVFEADGSLFAVRHRHSLLAGSLFHFGIVLLGASLVGHLLTVDSTTFRVTEGQEVGSAAEAAGVTDLPAEMRYLVLDSIEPRYYEDVLLFTRLDARMTAADGSPRDISLSDPYWARPTVLMSVSDYGLAPHIAVTSPDGTSDEYVVSMNLSPPGTEDAADIPSIPLQISMQAYPDYGVVDGRDVSLSYNIDDPAFLISIAQPGRTGSLLARQLLRLGEPLEAAGYVIEVSDLSRYGTFRVTHAPALPFMAFALLLTTIAVAWRFLFRRSTVVVWSDGDGVLVDAWADMAGRAGPREAIVARLREGR